MTVEIRAARSEERAEISDLVNLAFQNRLCAPGTVGWSENDPHDRPENTRVLTIGGRIVSVTHVGERHAYALGHEAPIGFLTAVCTHPEYRGRGYMRRVLADAEAYMQKRGFCYGVLFGSFGMYGGPLRWHEPGEKADRLGCMHVVLSPNTGDPNMSVRRAASEDVRFLVRAYAARYSRLLGPIVRCAEYWHRWSLTHRWEGDYMVICEGRRVVGYFHASPDGADIDEIGWEGRSTDLAARIFMTATSWVLGRGHAAAHFWISERDSGACAGIRAAFKHVQLVPCKPNGEPAETDDPTPWLPENWPDGVGYMVKFLNPGPGVLASVTCTDSLTEVMSRYDWTTFEGDWM